MSVGRIATYLDMKYDAVHADRAELGGIHRRADAYDWDPAAAAEGVPESAILGVEAPLWTETVASMRDVEFLAFPRLAAIAEVGWSRGDRRSWEEFRVRLGDRRLAGRRSGSISIARRRSRGRGSLPSSTRDRFNHVRGPCRPILIAQPHRGLPRVFRVRRIAQQRLERRSGRRRPNSPRV